MERGSSQDFENRSLLQVPSQRVLTLRALTRAGVDAVDTHSRRFTHPCVDEFPVLGLTIRSNQSPDQIAGFIWRDALVRVALCDPARFPRLPGQRIFH